MGKGSKSTREMNSLVKVLKRNRNLKKTSRKSYPRPLTTPDGRTIEYNDSNVEAGIQDNSKPHNNAAIQDNSKQQEVAGIQDNSKPQNETGIQDNSITQEEAGIHNNSMPKEEETATEE